MTEREIFEHALQIADIDDRAAYIAIACGNDEPLAEQIGELLSAHAAAGSFLNSPAGVGKEAADTQLLAVQRPAPAASIAAIGDVVAGKYKLLQIIGEGGMGVVYMAEQRQPLVRRVAIKIIKPGLQSGEVLARFEAERQALAVMDHPHIAKVLDAGTTDVGLPYFVMELVHGVPITRYCNEAQLSLTERLALFVPVCHAVQHAHQKGIIHRDIKPSNVLVAQYDGKPVPKVIDFGVAKAVGQKLTDRTLFTQFGAVVGTLEYMSPEQATLNALDVDTRSDIYSLGVLLYELLTGETPMDRQRLQHAAFDEVLRVIRCDQPPKPSTRLSTSARLPAIAAERRSEPRRLPSLVRGELDWIVMKALEKERDRRYDTAKDFADDVERHLANEPIAAGPPSSWYRLRKFAQRNSGRLKAAAGMAVILSVAAGLVFWFAFRAKSSFSLAAAEQQRANDAERKTKETRKQALSQQMLMADLGGVIDSSAAPASGEQIANTLSNVFGNPLFGATGKVWAEASKLAFDGVQLAQQKKTTEALDHFDRAVAMLRDLPKNQNIPSTAMDKVAGSVLATALSGRASVLDGLHRDAEADQAWDEAIQAGPPDMRALLRATRLESLLEVGSLAKARAKADEWTSGPNLLPVILIAAAKVYAQSAAADPDHAQAEKNRKRAIALLEQAENQGYFAQAPFHKSLATSADWKPLRGTPEFDQLVSRVAAAPLQKPIDTGALMAAFNMIFAVENADDPVEAAELIDRAMSRIDAALPANYKNVHLYVSAMRDATAGLKLNKQGQHAAAIAKFDDADKTLIELSKLPASPGLPQEASDTLRAMIKAGRKDNSQPTRPAH